MCPAGTAGTDPQIKRVESRVRFGAGEVGDPHPHDRRRDDRDQHRYRDHPRIIGRRVPRDNERVR